MLSRKFLSLTYPILKSQDKIHATGAEKKNLFSDEFAAIIHYCVWRTRSRLDECDTQKKLLLKSGYHHIGIHPDHRASLGFAWKFSGVYH